MKRPGFILSIGRSGTMWVATALKEAAGTGARHESVETWGEDTRFSTVEVNSFFWNRVPEIRERFGEDVVIVHLVRDGRDVVRSVLHRQRPGRTLATASDMWRRRNHYLRKMIPAERRFRFEDLTSHFSEFAQLSKLFGGKPQKDIWKTLRNQRINATRDTIWPPFKDWHPKEQEVFWTIAGTEMRAMGYER